MKNRKNIQAQIIEKYCIKNNIPLVNLSIRDVFKLNDELGYPIIIDHYINCLHKRIAFNIADLKNE